MDTVIKLTDELYQNITNHLIPEIIRNEEACFCFFKYSQQGNQRVCDIHEWLPLQQRDFDHQYGDYLQLTDEARRRVIKRAHDTNTAIAEIHSHPFPYPAAFSYADKIGLRNFVPHVLWRLPERPYVAIVVAPDGYDALYWDVETPQSITCIDTGRNQYSPTNLSIKRWENDG